MKIGMLTPSTISGRQNGIVSQALTWKAGLEDLGVQVDLISPWETYTWQEYSAVHIFGSGYFLDIIPYLKLKGVPRIVLSPIFDGSRSDIVVKLLSSLRLKRANWKTAWSCLRDSLAAVDIVHARSEFEARKLKSIFDVPPDKLRVSRLPVRFADDESHWMTERKEVCSHVSILSSRNKNVWRLVEAAKRFQFPLRLAGHVNNRDFHSKLEEVIRNSRNIEYLGVLDEAQLREFYLSTKVFALPSIFEGVGLVALEAAYYGADIVITERGGPKEYYDGMARLVNPESVDDIGQAVCALLEGATHQPRLSQHIRQINSIRASAEELRKIYAECA